MDQQQTKTQQTEWEYLIQKHEENLHKRKRRKYGTFIEGLDQKTFEAELQTLKDNTRNLRLVRFFDDLEPSLKRLETFSSAVSSAVQCHPNPCSLIWGSLQALLKCALHFASTFSQVANMVGQLTKAVCRCDRYTAILNPEATSQLHVELREVYDGYVGFCIAALMFYNEMHWYHKLATTVMPIKEKFESIQKRVASAVEAFEQEVRVTIDERTMKFQEDNSRRWDNFENHFNLVSVAPIRLPKICQIPYTPDEFFHGRGPELKRMHSWLQQKKSKKKMTPALQVTSGFGLLTQEAGDHGSLAVNGPGADAVEKRNLCVVHSMGGVGKTRLTIEYAYSHSDEYDYIFWLAAEDEATLSRDFGAIARLVSDRIAQDAEPSNPARDISKAKRWLEEEPRRWLLVYDNVEDWPTVERYWPHGDHGSIIITSQHSDIARIPEEGVVALDTLPPQAGGKLLLKILKGWKGATTSEEDDKLAERVSNELGGLPEAIRHMAGYIHQTGSTLSEFLDMYMQRPESRDIWAWGRSEGYQYSRHLTDAFRLSLDRLPDDARALLNVLSTLNPDRIFESLIFETSDKRKSRSQSKRALLDLGERQLVQRGLVGKEGFWKIHRALQLHVLHQLDKNVNTRQETFTEAVRLVRKAYPRQSDIQAPSNDNWHIEESCMPHVIHLQWVFEGSEPGLTPTRDLATLLGDVGNYMWERALYQKGKGSLELAERIYQEQPWSELIEHSKVSTILGVLTQEIGISGRARGLELLQKSLELRVEHAKTLRAHGRTASTEEILLLANAWNDVACSLLECSNYREAESFLLESLKIKSDAGIVEDGQAFFNFAENYKNLALVRLTQKQYTAPCGEQGDKQADRQRDQEGDEQKHEQEHPAVKLIEHAVQLMESHAGVQTASTQAFKFHHANILMCLDDVQKGLEQHIAVRNARAQIFGNEEVHSLNSEYACGHAYYVCGQNDKARESLLKCVEINDEVPWPAECKARALYHLGLAMTGEPGSDIVAQKYLRHAAEVKQSIEAGTQGFNSVNNKISSGLIDYDHLVSFEAGRSTIGQLQVASVKVKKPV